MIANEVSLAHEEGAKWKLRNKSSGNADILIATGCGRQCIALQRRDHLDSRKVESMAYIIAKPCIDVKDTACVDACPVDCIHPKKNEASFATDSQLYIHPGGMYRLWGMRSGMSGLCNLCFG